MHAPAGPAALRDKIHWAASRLQKVASDSDSWKREMLGDFVGK
jgi:hypothetical protein